MSKMMKVRNLIGLLVLLTVIHGCASHSVQSSAAMSQPLSSNEMRQCDGIPVQRWVGRDIDDPAKTEILKVSGADVARLIHSGEAITMDYRTDRINLELDERGYLVRAYCG
ncbi:I78 family peptidase inhibitor [Sphingorhabdus sp.]|uniref:I78 family peptidase inhibitor n=1 Tax=Sphingorhabdus sp. TaxID=1902408 RepID=UPI00391951CC